MCSVSRPRSTLCYCVAAGVGRAAGLVLASFLRGLMEVERDSGCQLLPAHPPLFKRKQTLYFVHFSKLEIKKKKKELLELLG